MAAKKPRRKAPARPPTLHQHLARLQRQVGREVHKAVAKAERDLQKERRKLARAVKAGEKQLVRQERALAKKVKAAVDAAERRAGMERRKLEQLAKKGVWGPVDALQARPRRRRR